MRIRLSLILVLLWSGSAWTQEVAPGTSPAGASAEQFKSMSGMSVLGNNEAPKSLVIVPWKSSQIGDGIGVVDSLDDRPVPVDRDVFSRELRYYSIRNGSDVVEVGSR